jgi:hypothetical protein
MMPNPIAQLSRLGGILALLVTPLVLAAEAAPDFSDWQRLRDEAITRDGLEGVALLEVQTVLLQQLLDDGWPVDLAGWEWLASVLEGWEGSPEVVRAREAYLGLLDAICSNRVCRDDPAPDEPALRLFLQRALGVAQTPVEEGRFLFYLAESWLREGDLGPALERRVESLLQQSVALLEDRPPADAAHSRLAALHWRWGMEAEGEGNGFQDKPYLTQAVFHFSAVRELRGARTSLLEEAAAALAELSQSQLELRVENRFLPHEDARVVLRGRNPGPIQLTLVGLPPEQPALPLPMERLREALTRDDPEAGQILLQEEHVLGGRFPFDWQEKEVRLAESLPGGWYGLLASAGDLVEKALLLVSPLEVAALPRAAGGWLFWVVDGEIGHPAANANISLMGADGEVLGALTTNLDGMAVADQPDLLEWHELHVLAGSNPGYLQRADIPQRQAAMPWVAANPTQLLPGSTLHWAMLGLGPELRDPLAQGVAFSLPDGTLGEPVPVSSGPDWIAGTLQVPATLLSGGPVRAVLPGGHRVHVAHVRPNRPLPLQIEFAGDPLHPSFNLFLAATPTAIRISPSFGVVDEFPDYIRLRISALNRDPVEFASDGSREPPPRLVHESIIPFEPSDPGGAFFELPELASGREMLPLKIEIRSLDDSILLGEAIYGLSAFRNSIRVSSRQPLLRLGEPAEIQLEAKFPGASFNGPIEGELVVYRETWESRYIHRKRGTPLSEAEYLALPDRSLLGSAKTDYRLDEQGFVREEARRLPVVLDSGSATVELTFERPGYYNIEYETREVDTIAHYPEGPAELWVMPESGDLRAFRSTQPRLVMDTGPEGELELLILADRTEATVLIDLEWDDGTVETHVRQLDNTAQFLRLTNRSLTPMPLCRAFLVGDRRTDLLWQAGAPKPEAEWVLDVDRLFGLNPGAQFSWEFRAGAEAESIPDLWTIYPEEANFLRPQRLRWQQALQARHRARERLPAAYLGRQFPLPMPFTGPVSEQLPPAAPLSFAHVDPDAFVILYPEVMRFPPAAVEGMPFAGVEALTAGQGFVVSGAFPGEAGRWNLSLMGAGGGGGLQTRSWLLSTELPIRSELAGPDLLRAGDKAWFSLQVENRTGDQAGLEAVALFGSAVGLEEPLPKRLTLLPYQREKRDLPVKALGGWAGTLEIRLDGSGFSTTLVHDLQVLERPPSKAFSFLVAAPQIARFDATLDLSHLGSAELVLSSGLGSLLPLLWPYLREVEGEAEPLLAVIGDWAVDRVLRHHGIDSKPVASEPLIELLKAYQVNSGGWNWLPGGQADPWLSAFILWTLEHFARQDDTAFSPIRQEGRQYLESTLINERLDSASRLFALRALAARAFHDSSVRPSRIQARSFLDFVHRRASLSHADLALLLQVAKAYRFREEIDLLAAELGQRIDAADTRTPVSFWTASLAFLALEGKSPGAHTATLRLSRALEALGREGPRRSWEQVAGFFNLLAAYYWRGEFLHDGFAEISVGEGQRYTLSLEPDSEGRELYRLPLDASALEAGTLSLGVDTTSALGPVILATVGLAREPDPVAPVEWAGSALFREYQVETLLRGGLDRVSKFDPAQQAVRVGDLVQMRLQLDVEESHAHVELHFPVPAGLALDKTGIEHGWAGPDGPESPGPLLWLDPANRGNPLTRILRMDRLAAGRHTFRLSYSAFWAGRYTWPAPRLFIPRTGEVHTLDAARWLTVEPVTGQAPVFSSD